MRMRRFNAFAIALIAIACGSPGTQPLQPSPVPPLEPSGPTPPGPATGITAVLVGAGDIANCAGRNHERTAAILDGIGGTVITLGDNVYENGTVDEYQQCYERSWGRHKGRTRPSPGNHDYNTAGAAGYFGYFGAQAGPSGLGYYSYFAGDWQVFSLNSQVAAGTGSPQYQWLQSELAGTRARCRLAYWHHPVFNSGFGGDHDHMREIWRLLFEHGADVVLTGHAHNYERFARLNADGLPDERGMRQFVVGTGGGSFTAILPPRPHSEVLRGDMIGVLELMLEPTRYKWRFIPAEGWRFTDSGAADCN